MTVMVGCDSHTRVTPMMTHHFSECKVIGSCGEGADGPVLQHTPRDHVGLDIFENISQDLMADLGSPGLYHCQPFVVTADGGVVFYLVLQAPFFVDIQQRNRRRAVFDQTHLR